MADESQKAVSNDSLNSKEVEKPQIQPISLPTVEEIRGQDIWNNCAVRSVVSGVMGMLIYSTLTFFIPDFQISVSILFNHLINCI